jgi:large subunit ribosomal protein L1
MVQRSKAWKEATSKLDKNKSYTLEEATALLKSWPVKKFDETVEAVLRLNVDPRKADQAIRGVVSLPHGTGKTAKVVVIAQADAADAARAAGADEVGGDELIDKIFKGYTDFDSVVATPDLMGKVGKLGKVLGPRGLMPNPKLGTVTMDTGKAVADIKGGKIEFRVDKNGNLAFIIGKLSFDAKKLAENFKSVLDEVLRMKPTTIKGRYITKGTISSTMNPGIGLDLNTLI